MGIYRGSGPLGSGPTGPGSGFSVMPFHFCFTSFHYNESSDPGSFAINNGENCIV